MTSKTGLQSFLSRYLGSVYRYGREGRYEHTVTQEEIDGLVSAAGYDGTEQEIIDYGTKHPEAPFWELEDFIKPGLKGGLTEEDMLEDD